MTVGLSLTMMIMIRVASNFIGIFHHAIGKRVKSLIEVKFDLVMAVKEQPVFRGNKSSIF